MIHRKIELISLLLITFVLTLNAQAPLAEGQLKFLGCAWSSAQNTNFTKYWNQVTPENGGKWGTVEYSRNVMNWNAMDAAYNLAGNYGYTFKHHTLIWGNQQPSWIENLDTAIQRQEIEEWFSLAADRYGDIDFIDVVNEPLHAPPSGPGHGNYINALGGNGISGWDWVIRAFRMAREYFPESELLLNEYNIVNSEDNTEEYLEIINLLVADSLIDGIGVQAHAFSTYGTSGELIRRNLDSLASTGLPVYVSELDIDGPSDYEQLKEYQRIFPVFWEHPAVAGITLWGFRYGLWRNTQGAYLVDQNGTERPAFNWLKAYVNDTLTLSQSVSVVSDDDNDTIYIDETVQMSAFLLPENTTIRNVFWGLLTAGVAIINEDGLLTPTTPGKVRVRAIAWDTGKTGVKDIVIINRPVESVTIIASGDTITTDETLQLDVLVLPGNATVPGISWNIVPDGFASIDGEGLLTPLFPGTVTVIAIANDGSDVSDSLDITIILPTPTATFSEDRIRIYPNPAKNGKFTIQNTGGITGITIIDLYGRRIREYSGLNTNFLEVELITSRGLHLIRFTDGVKPFYRKIIVE